MSMYKSDTGKDKKDSKSQKNSDLKNSSKKTSKSSLIGKAFDLINTFSSNENFEAQDENLSFDDVVNMLESDYVDIGNKDTDSFNEEISDDKENNISENNTLSNKTKYIDNNKDAKTKKHIGNFDGLVNMADSDYTKIISENADVLSNKISDNKKDNLSNKTKNNKNHIYKKHMRNNSQEYSSKKDSDEHNGYLPSRKKDRKHIEDLNEIIINLKKDYFNLNEIFDTFQKFNFSSVDDSKGIEILNYLEEQIFNKLKNLNNIDKLAKSNENIKNTLNLIFKSEDITAQCVMYAYNIYSFIKMFHYDKEHLHKTYIEKTLSPSSSSSDDNNKNNKHRFNKLQFDSLKFIRDEEIHISDLKTSDSLTLQEHFNMNTLKNDRSIMEGIKSNIRLEQIEKTRAKNLTMDIRNSKKSLNNFFSNSSIISFDYLQQSAQNGFKLIKMYRNTKK